MRVIRRHASRSARRRARGTFRDLFYRLNVFPIAVPPLRERRTFRLVEYFSRHVGERLHAAPRRLTPASMDLLSAYAWPGNIRELENVLERAMVVATGDELHIDPTWLPRAAAEPIGASLADSERRTILDALAACHGKIYGASGAAQRLGLKPSTLYGKMRKHGIGREPAAFARRDSSSEVE